MLDSQGFSTSSGLSRFTPSSGGLASPESVRHPHVLLVDDDVDNLMLLSYIFEQFLCSVVCETEGEAALEQIQQSNFDLVILDIQLPGVSGLEVVEVLRANPLRASIPVIAVTALARPQERDMILQAGCDRYISKPFMVEELEKLIGLYLKPR
jgi:CheY-like chemotaxis protein